MCPTMDPQDHRVVGRQKVGVGTTAGHGRPRPPASGEPASRGKANVPSHGPTTGDLPPVVGTETALTRYCSIQVFFHSHWPVGGWPRLWTWVVVTSTYGLWYSRIITESWLNSSWMRK